MVPMGIRGIAMDPVTETPLVILHNTDFGLVLPVRIGAFEASSILMELEKVHPARPLTHDLIGRFFEAHGFKLIALELYGVLDDGYLARLRYKKGARWHEMEVRPSDGIALALRMGAPMLASEAVFEAQAGSDYILDEQDYAEDGELVLVESGKLAQVSPHHVKR